MTCVFSTKRTLMTLFLLMLFFAFTKSEPEQVDFEGPTKTYKNQGNKDYKFVPKFKEPNHSFLKIEMKADKSNVDFIFSFYKGDDPNLNKRIQLCQSISGKAFIFLKKEELGNEFYIKTEFKGETSNFTLVLTQTDEAKISIGEQFSYYVTKENQQMEFIIVGKPEIKYNYTNFIDPIGRQIKRLSIWAKGSQDLNTEIPLLSMTRKSLTKKSFSSHIIELEKDDDVNYHFKVQGKEGDLIKVGSFLFNEGKVCQTLISDHNMELFGFLKRDSLDVLIFLTKISEKLDFTYKRIIGHNEYPILQINPNGPFYENFEEDLNAYMFSLDNDETEKFYSFEFKKNETNMINTYLMLLGPTYKINLEKGESIGLIPMNTNTNYLTLHTTAERGKYNAAIKNCTNYPFCENNNSNKTKLVDYNSASISYDSTQYNKDSVIQKNQNLLLLNCETSKCVIFVNMFTENNNITIVTETPYYRYLRGNNEDNLIIDLSQNNKYLPKFKFNLHIEILSGISNAEITFPDGQKIKQLENMLLYQANKENQTLYSLKIKAKKNIVYSIIALFENGNIVPQMNYLRKFNSKEKYITMYPQIYDSLSLLYYIGLSLKNNDMYFKINNVCDSTDDNVTLLQKDGYYQNFKDYNNAFSAYCQVYNIFSKSNHSETNETNANNSIETPDVFYRISVFRFMSDRQPDESIIISYGVPYPFIFTKNIHKFKYSYLLTNKSEGFNMRVELIDKINYNVELSFNDKLYKNYSFNDNNNVIISPKEMGQLQVDNTQAIKISFVVSSDKIQKETTFNLTIVDYKQEEPKKKDDKTKKLLLFIGIPLICVLFIIIIIVLIFLCKNKSKYDKLKEQVNSISFKKDEALQRDSKDDDLLE